MWEINKVLIFLCFLIIFSFGCAIETTRKKTCCNRPDKNRNSIEYHIQWEYLELIGSKSGVEKTQDIVRKILDSEFIEMAKFWNVDILEITIPKGKLMNEKTLDAFDIKGKCIVYDEVKSDMLKKYPKYNNVVTHTGKKMISKRNDIKIEIDNYIIKTFRFHLSSPL